LTCCNIYANKLGLPEPKKQPRHPSESWGPEPQEQPLTALDASVRWHDITRKIT
jgi:hypothetical protein